MTPGAVNKAQESMKPGDLVRGRQPFRRMLGIIVEVVSEYDGEKFLLVRWNGGTLDTLRDILLEVISESR